MSGPSRTGASRYAFDDLVEFAADLLVGAGLGSAQAHAVAEVLAEADLLGHDTHGLQLLASYLAELEKGAMTKDGEPRVLADIRTARKGISTPQINNAIFPGLSYAGGLGIGVAR